jgi:hypothetical protein
VHSAISVAPRPNFHHAIRLQDVCVKCTRTSKLVIRQVPVATSEPATPVDEPPGLRTVVDLFTHIRGRMQRPTDERRIASVVANTVLSSNFGPCTSRGILMTSRGFPDDSGCQWPMVCCRLQRWMVCEYSCCTRGYQCVRTGDNLLSVSPCITAHNNMDANFSSYRGWLRPSWIWCSCG